MRFVPVTVLLLASAAFTQNAELAQVQSVYLLPMSSALDQYLANRITNLGVYQVVTDPQKADAILTDRLGEVFERQMQELYASEEPPPAKDDEKESKEAKQPSLVLGERDVRPFIGRAKGTVFLVDRQSRRVLWSVYDRPKYGSPADLDRVAERIARKLRRDLKGS